MRVRLATAAIQAIAPSRSAQIPAAQLTTPHGGPIAAVDKQGALIPDAALYLVQIDLAAPPSLVNCAATSIWP
jgi:putative peptide zinc metalloprotease protein